jgi:hypothetical protein
MTKLIADKLGWKPGMGTQVWRIPQALQQDFTRLMEASTDAPTFRIAFAKNAAELEEAAQEVAARYVAGGHLWLCYLKKTGRIKSDITRDVGWDKVHALDLLGVKQVAIDQDWSALRFRLRAEIPVITRSSPTGALPKPKI